MRFFAAAAALLGVSSALPADNSIAFPAEHSLEKRGVYNPPRNLVYIQTFRRLDGGQFSMLPLINNPTQISHVYISALHINPDPKGMHINDDPPNSTKWDTMWSEAAQLQEKGVKVLYMMGGAAPGSYPRLCSGPRNTVINETYYMPLYWELKYHKLDGIDLDIEERVPVSCPVALLKRLYKDFGPQFITTMSPVASELQPSGYGLGGFSYKTLEANTKVSNKPNGQLVNWFNTQFYNGWGDASNANGYNAIIRNGYAANRVVLGVLSAQSNGGSGFRNISTYQKTIATLKANYGSAFGCVNEWEYFNAGSNDGFNEPWKYVGTIGNALFGTKNTFTKRQITAMQDFNATITDALSPWPQLTERLKRVGVVHLEAVRALNQSNGNLDGAIGILRSLGINLPVNLPAINLPGLNLPGLGLS